MEFHAPSHLLQSYSLLTALIEIQQLGFVGSEIWSEHLENNPPSIKELKSLGLEYSFHAPSWDINPTSRLREVRDFAINLILKSLEFASEIEAKPVIVHSGHKSNPKNDFLIYKDFLYEFLEKLGSRAKELGLQVAIEIMDFTPNQLVNTPQIANQLTTIFPSLQVCFDIAHAGRFIDPLEQLALTQNVGHFHLSNTSREIPHIALTEGHLDIAKILNYIAQHYPETIIAVEGFDPNDELGLIKKNLAYLKSLNFWTPSLSMLG